jgi:4-amino-4-deoxy-L-arabinose transferase-like glycosyltransferase
MHGIARWRRYPRPVAASGTDTDERGHARILAALTGLVILALWVVPMTSSLWVDELGTWWVVQAGLGHAIDRAWVYHGQSPLYYMIEWAARAIGGGSEVALRVPSLAASAGSAVVLAGLVRRLIGREAARIAVLVFAATSVVAFEASEARPYAIATLAVVAATSALVRWLDEGGWTRAVVYAVLAVLVVWVHYLFALALISHGIYAVVRLRRGQTGGVGVRHLAAVAGLMVAGALPLVIQAVSLWGRRSSLSIPADATIQYLLAVFVPPVLLGAIFLGGLLARSQGPLILSPPPAARPSSLVLFVSWLLIPVATLFLVSAVTPVTLLSPRYFASAMPAAAALAGWAISAIEPASARRIIAGVLAIFSVVAYGGTLKLGEDWRGAAAFERARAGASTIVLLHPALIESAQLDWFEDPERRSYLLSVASYYPMDGRVTPMPYTLDDEARVYLEGLVADELIDVDRFLLVTRYPQVPFRDWLDGRLTPEGYGSRVIGTFGVIQVIEFSRPT